MRCGRVLLLLVALLSAAHGVKILGLFAVSGKSHTHFISALTTELSRRGHNVTVVTAFPTSFHSDNYREIFVDTMAEMKARLFNPFEHTEMNILRKLSHVLQVFLKLCPAALKDKQIRPLLDEKFDLVIISTFFNQCFLPFGHYYGAPVIGISSAGSLGFGMDLANPEPPSYVPSIFLPFTAHMTFSERAVNFLITNLLTAMGKYLLNPRMEDAAKEFFSPYTFPDLEELERNMSLLIYNNHFSLNGARPLLPGVIDTGGMHIKPKSEPLPKDLQEYMDGAKDGVIYFSMGTVIQGSEIPKGKLDALLSTFAELPQRVIFKWEQDSMPGKPRNVKIGKYLPQQSILSHPKTKMFITHGGLLSTQEAAFYGVPLVGIPLFGDQQLNVAKSARMGLAVALEFNTMTKASILAAVKTILDNPSFRKNAKNLQRKVRDQPQSPLETAVFWTEYVIRHNGATHMKSAATDMPWWQVHLVDVYALIFTVFFAVFYIEWKLIKWCCCRKTKSAATTISRAKRTKNVIKAKMQ